VALEPYCERVHAVGVPLARSLWNCVRGLAGAAPLQACYCRSPVMTAIVRAAAAQRAGCDVLHVEHLRAAPYGLPAAGLPSVYDGVDCMTRLLGQTAADGPTLTSRLTARFELPRTRRFERELVRRFDRVVVSAENEREALLALAAPLDRASPTERVHVVPNGVDPEYFAPLDVPREPATLIFLGRMGYHANLAAARRLVTEIMPRVWARRPEARVLVVGPDPPAELRALAARAGSRVEVTGYVPDVRPYLGSATVSVSPLSYAVGVQNKVLEAMAMATPVVATPAAAAGLHAVHGEHLLAAEDADAFAASVRGLLDDPAWARRLGVSGRRYVEAQHDWVAVARQLEAIYCDAIASCSSAARSHIGAAPV
jgi:glycosyltransferase involved in cell wall biosynthesis